MNESARTNILTRLEMSLPDPQQSIDPVGRPTDDAHDRSSLMDSLKRRMEAVNAEIHVVPSDQWTVTLKAIMAEKNIHTLLFGPQGPLGEALQNVDRESDWPDTTLVPYTQAAETLKTTIFETDAGITAAAGAVADTGALILRPDQAEPRLMSLVPPIHIAVLDADDIYPDLTAAMEEMHWSQGMPSNMLLISGPSKTADIEFTLAYGVHGPKALCVIIRV